MIDNENEFDNGILKIPQTFDNGILFEKGNEIAAINLISIFSS